MNPSRLWVRTSLWRDSVSAFGDGSDYTTNEANYDIA